MTQGRWGFRHMKERKREGSFMDLKIGKYDPMPTLNLEGMIQLATKQKISRHRES